MNEDKLAEQFIKVHGWKKQKGYVFDMESIRDCPEEWDKMYIEELDDYIHKCQYWGNENNDYENCFEDVWDVVEFIENNSEENFDKWKELKKLPSYKEKGKNRKLGGA